MATNSSTQHETGLTLVLGGTGKTGSRVAHKLNALNVPVRVGSRAATPAFDWNNDSTWDASLDGVESVYITYVPDLAIPGATDAIQALVKRAKHAGVKKAVILSGRGETEAQACEKIVINSGLAWTVVRASWFNQNFSEGAFIDMVREGQIALPAGDVLEPFVDADDIADVAVAALTTPGHDSEIYEVTGPRLLSIADIAAELSQATGRTVQYTDIPHAAFVAGVGESGAPADVVWIMDYLFSTVLDGRNAYVTDGVQRALGRPAKDFSDYARAVAASGAWRSAA